MSGVRLLHGQRMGGSAPHSSAHGILTNTLVPFDAVAPLGVEYLTF